VATTLRSSPHYRWQFRWSRSPDPLTRCPRVVGTLLAAIGLGLLAVPTVAVSQGTQQQAPPSAAASAGAAPSSDTAPSLETAKHHFFNAHFETAVEVTRVLEVAHPDDLAIHEMRSSALLFQLKRLLEPRGRKVPLNECPTCPALIEEFTDDFHHARALAHTKVAAAPDDVDAKFFLGKLNLNYIWLQLGPLGKKTGWKEYWEGRRSLDEVLAARPDHVRARIGRAWIDYIVDTRMPWGTEWMLGGGDRKRALRVVREAAASEQAEYYAHVEAEFALWEMLVKERNIPGATEVARRLANDFPDNKDIATFLESQRATSKQD
jgi:GNAT superfamily N-acetyltransferase